MASKSKRARSVKQRNLAKNFMYWAIAVFIIKLFIIGNVPGGAWLGADGENYIKGFEALTKDGIFSKENFLSYWPAGYPLFMLLLSIFGKSYILTTLSVIQSIIFSFSVYYFSLQVSKTRLRKFSYLTFVLILLNPTLSLSSISVGYESIVASGFLFILGVIVKDLTERNENNFTRNVLIVSGAISLISFVQPRLIVSGIVVLIIWILKRRAIRSGSLIIIFSIAISLFMPATLIYRNHVAIKLNTISTNGSAAFIMGAGKGATGGYVANVVGVPCQPKSTDSAKIENEKILCVLKWYLGNPVDSVKLFLNKSKYLWSPWYGPEANGTMARNPWLKISPIKNISTTPDGNKLVLGTFGKLISWAWFMGGLFFMFWGAWRIFKSGGSEKYISIIISSVIIINWMVVLITIGDHRFRLPMMGASLFLQSIGIQNLLFRRKIPA
jgi:hypothetical protein